MSQERTLDVRPMDAPPFPAIEDELERLEPGATLRLINDFEPSPLYDVLEQRGFVFSTTNPAPDEWHVRIRVDTDSGE
ncbi:MAG: DUF2249 domain-containing protein [Natronomonas sp.]